MHEIMQQHRTKAIITLFIFRLLCPFGVQSYKYMSEQTNNRTIFLHPKPQFTRFLFLYQPVDHVVSGALALEVEIKKSP
jgi:hypothetical protein